MNSGNLSKAGSSDYGRTALTFVDSLSRLTSLDDIRNTTAGGIRAFGFDFFTLVDMPSHVLNRSIYFFLNAYPSEWVDLYLQRNFDAVDPVIRQCFATTTPFEWDETRYEPDGDAGVRQMMGLAGEYGLRYGFSFAVRQTRGPISCFSLSSRDRPDLDGVTKPAIHLMALYALARAETLRDPSRIVAPALSNREREVLTWSAVGKTSSQIADILRITERTVLGHAVNAVSKLDASNRTHAVAKALALGLIKL